jgi:putative FmdB family regulatory protein
MPFYDFECPACGRFTLLKPIARRDEPQDCPACGAMARREVVTAAALSCMTTPALKAAVVNEQSCHAPRVWQPGERGSDKPQRTGEREASARRRSSPQMKGFPGARPWMIGH